MVPVVLEIDVAMVLNNLCAENLAKVMSSSEAWGVFEGVKLNELITPCGSFK